MNAAHFGHEATVDACPTRKGGAVQPWIQRYFAA